MTATVVSLPPNSIVDAVDFLRRLAGMMTGGRNAEMLLQAAAMIEALTHRAVAAEQLLDEQRDESARHHDLCEVAEIAADKLIAEVRALKIQIAEGAWRAETERSQFAEEARRLQALLADAEMRIEKTTTELADVRATLDALGKTAVLAPVETLRLARAQFDYLATSFAKAGDVVSQSICEIGGCAIDSTLAAGHPEPREP